ncbi:right-handed parallel beta-helix repeat-containing protein [Flavimarina sp. Hel_I_48]|uniref:right-handed parallel beta-helix repeat-containing protein n=1 Tax=Flavimarina sp. Hel_I_48 TaxID=1392488 RepID=UPI0004DF1054|nr:right-handed parallel beta-helix repeat-containing protein [Flavimarina sp. Hel_I_48]
MVSNTTLDLDCLSDLGGKTINLPKGANLKYDGGSLSNGILNFDGGTIDGRLLSKGLKITGNVQLSNNTVQFNPSQWGIVQGWTSRNNAKENKLAIREAIDQVKELGGNTLEIGTMDAYLYVGNEYDNPNWYSAEEGVSIPSNFTLKMSDNTHLRVYPNNHERYALLGMRGVTNAKVEGGHLHGDRDSHTYGGGSHEWGILFEIEGAQNSTVQNVSMSEAAGDGMTIHSLKFTWQDDYQPAKNITIDGCLFDTNRRNNLSITDGQNLIVENSTFKDAGVDTDKSKGTNPRFGIDVEAHRERVNGKIKYYERVDGLIIRNNVESGSQRGGFLVSIGDNVVFEGNQMEQSISYKYSKGTIIRNNTFKAKKKGNLNAIRGGISGTETISNNKIYGNTMEDYDLGIILYGRENTVYDNKIINCNEGIFVKDIKFNKINGNVVKSDINGSRGIFAHFTTIEDSEFNSNEIDVLGAPFNFTYVNRTSKEKNYNILVKDNSFTSAWYYSQIFNAHNLTFENNEISTSVRIQDAGNVSFKRNEIDGSSDNYPTLHFRGNSTNIEVFYNTIIAHRTNKGTVEDSSQDDGEITERGNTWRYMNR